MPHEASPTDECQECGAHEVVEDHWLGSAVCHACGHVADEGMLQDRKGYTDGEPETTWVAYGPRYGSFWGRRPEDEGGSSLGRSQTESTSAYRLTCRGKAMASLQHLCAVLRVQRGHQRAAESVLEEAVDGRWGVGAWMDALVAACTYIAIRRGRVPLSMLEVAEAAGLLAPQVWVVYRRALTVLADGTVPPLDPSVFIQRAVSVVPALSTWRGTEGQRQLVRDASAVLRLGMKHSLKTGRHPVALAAASVQLAALANQVPVSEDAICNSIYAASFTVRLRFTELCATLLLHCREFPWGKAVTEATLPHHLPFLLKTLPLPTKDSPAEADLAREGLPAPAFKVAESKVQGRRERIAQAKQRLKEAKHRWKSGADEGALPQGDSKGNGGTVSNSKRRRLAHGESNKKTGEQVTLDEASGEGAGDRDATVTVSAQTSGFLIPDEARDCSRTAGLQGKHPGASGAQTQAGRTTHAGRWMEGASGRGIWGQVSGQLLGDGEELRQEQQRLPQGQLEEAGLVGLESVSDGSLGEEDLRLEWMLLRKAPEHALESGWYAEAEAHALSAEQLQLQEMAGEVED